MKESARARARTPRRQRKTAGKPRARRAVGKSDTQGENWTRKVRAHRRRQASVGAILDEALGRFAECNPELWERRAYLMLIGLVYERLAASEAEISTDELVTLAKVLAENRRVEVRVRDDRRSKEAPEPESTGDGKLPECFSDVVRQIYGTSLDTAESDEAS